MRTKIHRGTIVGSSNLYEKLEALKQAHEEFEKSEFKQRLDKEWGIREHKPKRPRIKPTPKRVRVSVGGFIEITLEYSEWVSRGQLGTVLEELYV